MREGIPDSPRRCGPAGGRRALLAAMPSQADQGFYLGGIGGVTLDPDATVSFIDEDGGTATDRVSFTEGPAGSFVAGYTFASGLRPELELGYRRSDIDDSEARVETAQATGSLYYNFSRNGYFFYLGGGGGYAKVRLDAGAIGKDDDGSPVYSLGNRLRRAGRQALHDRRRLPLRRRFRPHQLQTTTSKASRCRVRSSTAATSLA